jgi:hypothetical protein
MTTQVPDIEPPDGITRNDAERIIKAFEDTEYKYRTVRGVAGETGLDPATVKRIVDWLGAEGVIMQSSMDDPDGTPLYTTRAHYRQKSSFWERLIASLRNRAD